MSWCHLNDEGDLLTRLIPGAVQVSGSDSDEEKEEKFTAFTIGQISKIVTKDSIGGFGMNWQHCDHMTTFPSHSWERYYQTVRRFWRFGQKNPVTVDVVTSEGEAGVLANMRRKDAQADVLFSRLVEVMNDANHIQKNNHYTKAEEIPAWLS